MIFVVMDLQLMAQHIGHFGGAGLTVVAESEMLAIAGCVRPPEDFPAVFAAQAQGFAVRGDDAIGVAEAAHRISITVEHFAELVFRKVNSFTYLICSAQ